MLLVTPVLFLLWQVNMSAVKTACGEYQVSTYTSRAFSANELQIYNSIKFFTISLVRLRVKVD